MATQGQMDLHHRQGAAVSCVLVLAPTSLQILERIAALMAALCASTAHAAAAHLVPVLV